MSAQRLSLELRLEREETPHAQMLTLLRERVRDAAENYVIATERERQANQEARDATVARIRDHGRLAEARAELAALERRMQ